MIKTIGKTFRITTLIAVCVVLLVTNLKFAFSKGKYIPYPIVFVSGIGTRPVYDKKGGSPLATWDEFIANYDNMFNVQDKSKYMTTIPLKSGEKQHLHYFLFHGDESIERSAEKLQKYVERIIRSYYPKDSNVEYYAPSQSRSVILVTHSMGGLISRKMLVDNKRNIQQHISSLIFIGTPHTGSALASMVILAKDEIGFLANKIVELQDLIMPEIDNPFPNAEIMVSRLLLDAVQKKHVGNNKLINNFIIGELLIDPYKESLGQMLIPEVNASEYDHKFAVSFEHDIEGLVKLDWISHTEYKAEQVYLKSLSKNIGVSSHTIYGIESDVLLSLANGIYFRANIEMGAANFDRNDYTCIANGYNAPGNTDGVVFGESQRALSTTSSEDEITASHISKKKFFIYNVVGETHTEEARDIVLREIDDPPIIESVRLVPTSWDQLSPTKFYVIVQVSDYLLADIEFNAGIDGRNNSIDFTGYGSPDWGYKPFVKYGVKFSKEREEVQKDGQGKITGGILDRDGKPVILKPGEFAFIANIFWLPIIKPSPIPNDPPPPSHLLTIEVKNVAQLKGLHPENTETIKKVNIVNPKFDFTSGRLIDIKPFYSDTSPKELPIKFSIQNSQPLNDVKTSANLFITPKGSPNTKVKVFADEKKDKLGYSINTNWNGYGDGGKIINPGDYETVYDYYILSDEWEKGDAAYVILTGRYKRLNIFNADPTFIQHIGSSESNYRNEVIKEYAKLGFDKFEDKLNSAYKLFNNQKNYKHYESKFALLQSIYDQIFKAKEKIVIASKSTERDYYNVPKLKYSKERDQIEEKKEKLAHIIIENTKRNINASLDKYRLYFANQNDFNAYSLNVTNP